MWGFTRQQQRALFLLLILFAIGCGILYYRKQLPPTPVNPDEINRIERFVESLKLEEELPKDSSNSDLPSISDEIPGTQISFPIDINTASQVQLTKIKGIGQKTAQNIIEYRNQHGKFKSIDELIGVKGIGKRKLEKLKDFVIVK